MISIFATFIAFITRILVSKIFRCLGIFPTRTEQKAVKPDCRPTKRAFECPYEYLLHTYGPHHFKNIISFLRPNLKETDPQLFDLALEVLDAVHFGAILVDDVTDNSKLRKGQPAAHHIYGSSEVVNRAYLVILNAMMKCQRTRPELVPFILGCITEIHQGSFGHSSNATTQVLN